MAAWNRMQFFGAVKISIIRCLPVDRGVASSRRGAEMGWGKLIFTPLSTLPMHHSATVL